jgi:hypothetical protein
MFLNVNFIIVQVMSLMSFQVIYCGSYHVIKCHIMSYHVPYDFSDMISIKSGGRGRDKKIHSLRGLVAVASCSCSLARNFIQLGRGVSNMYSYRPLLSGRRQKVLKVSFESCALSSSLHFSHCLIDVL